MKKSTYGELPKAKPGKKMTMEDYEKSGYDKKKDKEMVKKINEKEKKKK